MEPRLTGRHEELDVAAEILAQGSGLVVRGEAGVGKSRLLMAIRSRRVHVDGSSSVSRAVQLLGRCRSARSLICCHPPPRSIGYSC